MRCLHCEEPAICDMVVCTGHLSRGGGDEERAAKYAVAAIIYYRETGSSMLLDCEFDGLRSWLLTNQVYQRVDWLEKDMLMPDARHDLGRYPAHLHRMADEWLAAHADEVSA